MDILREREPGGFTESAWRWALVGAAALLPALAVAYALRRWAHGMLLPEVAAQYVIERVPGTFALWAISTLGKAAKPLGLLVAFGCFYAAATIFGFYFRRTYDVLPGESDPAKGVSFSAITSLMTAVLLAIIYFTAPGALAQYHFVPALVSLFAFNLLFGVGLAFASRSAREDVAAEPGATPSSSATDSDRVAAAPTDTLRAPHGRREFVAAAGVVIASLGLVGLIARDLLDYVGTGIGTLAGKLPSFLTPNDVFYVVQKDVGTPLVNQSEWHLRVEGHVERPYSITYDELDQLAREERTVTLQCIENQIGGALISNARWRGVGLQTLLARAGVRAGARRVVVWGTGGYSDSITVEQAADPNVLIAVGMNQQPLPRTHGFPARLLTPGLYGIKNVKWVERVEVITADEFAGYWQERGWSQAGTVKTAAKFSVPETGAHVTVNQAMRLVGVAFAGDRGISRVEVSTDKGQTWQPTTINDDPLREPTSWAVWSHEWTPMQAGAYVLAVRATDGSGVLQTAEASSVFPDGASGYHRIAVTVA